MNCDPDSTITDLSPDKSTKSNGWQGSETLGTLTYKINQLKNHIQEGRVASIREKVEENKRKIETFVSELVSSVAARIGASTSNKWGLGKLLSARIETPLCKIHGIGQGSGERDCFNCDEVVSPTTVKLPSVEKIPPYTTWIFLDRNQRMAEDQSVVGRRRIYYDPHGSEALICSDSEEEIMEPEEEKHAFSEGEDCILRMVAIEYGLDKDVLEILAEVIGGTDSEILERCNMFKKQSEEMQTQNYSKNSGESDSEASVLLGKSLSASLDSFDYLFCRRCLIFDCRLHGCSQVPTKASERHPYTSDDENEGRPCSDQCFLQPALGLLPVYESQASKEFGGSLLSDVEEPGKRRALEPLNGVEKSSGLIPDDLQGSSEKKLKSSVPDAVTVALECTGGVFDHSSVDTGKVSIHEGCSESERTFNTSIDMERHEQEKISKISKFRETRNSSKCSAWKPLEKELYLKGREIFGRNSCLIARNLLPGLKTCLEVSRYMNDEVSRMAQGFASCGSSTLESGRTNINHLEGIIPARSRLFRKRGRTRKLKYSWKSAGHPSIWRRIADGKNQSCKQYTPCGCESSCGKDCPCLRNGTCCEKYCGCSKSCKNRFRGCHCAKSQCRSRQCPCFAAGRECDPDVCRNCWVSCGDGSLGQPPRRDGQCGNMRLLLRQQQRILLAKSDVAGWGAFLKNPVNKNEYLGEYTGELVSHREADKRGKIYDRANSSFLFDLNDQYVLDAYRKGDKLKFANHSSNPNCYAKVMLVAGDHRVGIFAKERIEACEELFYDYRYGPDQAPLWARKPEGFKREDSGVSQGRAKKHQSH